MGEIAPTHRPPRGRDAPDGQQLHPGTLHSIYWHLTCLRHNPSLRGQRRPAAACRKPNQSLKITARLRPCVMPYSDDQSGVPGAECATQQAIHERQQCAPSPSDLSPPDLASQGKPRPTSPSIRALPTSARCSRGGLALDPTITANALAESPPNARASLGDPGATLAASRAGKFEASRGDVGRSNAFL